VSDPAMEAAQRARADRIEKRPTNDEIGAAREALKPIRELHRPLDLYLWATTACDQGEHQTAEDTNTGDPICLTCTTADGGPQKHCEECYDSDGSNIAWPCNTARLAYSTEELEHP
jgi:hypothetical protein